MLAPTGAAPVITGVGLVTPLGGSASATTEALMAGRRTADRLGEAPADASALAIAQQTCGTLCAGDVDPAIELAERAAREALGMAGVGMGGNWAQGMRTIVGSSKGAVMGLARPGDSGGRDAAAMLGPHGFLCQSLRERLELGETTAIVCACATGLAALHLAWRDILDGRADRVLVIAVEAALSELFVESYRRLGVLAPTQPGTAHVARPLDESRTGFTLCEASAAIVLESAQSAEKGGRGVARVMGAAMGTEPFDLVRAPAQYDTLERLTMGLIADGTPVALVQPHAPGTRDNDERELSALARAIMNPGAIDTAAPDVYASKGAIGHPLGAAGLVNTALGCCFMRAGKRPPMPWLEKPIESAFDLETESRELGNGAHIIAAAGFGGHVGVVRIDPIETVSLKS